MLHSTPAIVFNRIRHRDNKLIVTLYTQSLGLIPCSYYTPKKGGKVSLLEPLSIAETILKIRQNREIQELKELRMLTPLSEIRTDIRKSTVAIFISELLIKCTRHSGQDGSLFSFLSKEIIRLESTENPAYFHLHFIVRLIRELGIGPRNNYSLATPYFNESEALYKSTHQHNGWDEAESLLLSNLLHEENGQINARMRDLMLTRLLGFLSLQLQISTDLRSRTVLNEVFA